MSQRRTLVTGLEETPDVKDLERRFVYGDKTGSSESSRKANVSPVSETKNDEWSGSEDILPQYRSRVPLTTRCRPDLASALKRASLKRQLEGKEPCRIQEILEEAIEKWLKDHDYVG